MDTHKPVFVVIVTRDGEADIDKVFGERHTAEYWVRTADQKTRKYRPSDGWEHRISERKIKY